MTTTKSKTRHRTGAGETMNPDHIGMHRLIVVGVIVTLLAAIGTSWNGLIFVAGWQKLPEQLRWLTPVMIDVPLVVLTLVRGVLRKRGIRAGGLLWGILGLTLYSSTANFVHTVSGSNFRDLGVLMGALTNALAPWLILSLTEVLWLVITKPIRPRAPRKAAKRTTTRTARAPRAAAPQQPTLDFGAPDLYDPVATLREANR